MADNHLANPIKPIIPSTKMWIVVHILAPLGPFITGALVRLGSCLSISWGTFDASELALSFCLLSVFIRQSLLGSEILLPNRDKEEEVAGVAAECLLATFVFFGLFVTIEVFSTLVTERNLAVLQGSLIFFRIATFILSPLSLIFFVRVQKSFKLKARIR